MLNEQDYHIDYGDIAIGKEVTVRALFMSVGSIEMAAIEYDGANYCFRSNMLHPPKTESEKERDQLYQELYDMETGMDDYQINRVIEFIQGRDND